MDKKIVAAKLMDTIDTCQTALSEIITAENMAPNSAEDISARYWLMTMLEPLNRKELKSVVDGFLVQMLSTEQSSKIVKFLLARYPQYYKEELGKDHEPKEPQA